MGHKKSKAELLSEAEISKIFIFFKNHTAASTIRHFNLNRSTWNILCTKYNIKQHSSSESEELKHIEQDGYDILSTAEIDDIYEAYASYSTVEDTAEYCGIKEYFIIYLLKEREIPIHHKQVVDFQWREHLGIEKIKAIIKFYLQPNTLVDTAANFDIPVSQVRTLLLEHNVTLHTVATTELLGKNKQKNNLQAKYGVTNVFQLDNVKEKSRLTKLKKYNDSAYTNQKQREATCLAKYGAKTFLESELGRQAVIKYNNNKFGTDYAFQSMEWQSNPDYKQRRVETLKNNKYTLESYSEKYLEVCKDIKILEDFVVNKTIYEIAAELSVSSDHVYYLLSKYNLLDRIRHDFTATSHYEEEIVEFIGKDLCIRNDRSVLAGKEIDIYIPSKKLGIEFNGTYWHSTQIQPDHNYHFNKSKTAENFNIRLIHIYEYEWTDPIQQEKLKMMLNIALGRVATKIYARNCTVKQISNTTAKELNTKVHLQGHRNAQVTYGLFYENKLVQLMSFSKTKYNKNLKTDNSWEIIRGCPGSNNIVVGGVSKLFKYFIAEQSPEEIFSYCDFNKFNGKSYESLGMEFIGYTKPDMKWVLKNGQVVNRKPHKHAELKEQAVAQIFGAGSKKYIWRAKNN